MMKKFELIDDWKFKISSKKNELDSFNEWMDASVPGTVHTDLLNNKLVDPVCKIDEPFYDDNELKLGWIVKNNWIYKTIFDLPGTFTENLSFLVFEGLDTAAEIRLNGSLLGTSENMFIKYEFNVSNLLMKTGNKLLVEFKSPINYAKNLEEKFGKLQVALNSERVYIRKAQYSFGWDWGPSFPTMGIWRSVYLIQPEKIFIKSFKFSTLLIKDNHAEAEASLKLGGETNKNFKINFKLSCSDQLIEIGTESESKGEIKVKLNIPNPKLWYPNGEGDQLLYDFKAEVMDDANNSSRLIDSVNKKVGIRTIELRLLESIPAVSGKGNNNNTFKILVNDKPIFAKGVNWIPADSFLPRVTKDKYEKLLRFAKDGNMNIIRVWGGGIYENDIFYELCDRLGLLVWQDFMFACAAYPEHKEFLKSVEEEVKQNVQRLQHHPSIAIWCGNNENEWNWYREMKTSYKEMPGYKIYHDLIPKILKEIDTSRPYWQSSPFSLQVDGLPDEDPNSYSSGNRHEWGIWSSWLDYSEVKNDSSLFVTEFGFQGPANKKTFEKYLSEDKRYIQGSVFEFHNKQVEGPERIFKFLAGNLPIKTDWKDFIYLAQLNQALALKTCLEHWRINYPITNGSIIWQLNDCWPVTSWAIIDSELLPKISYYFVKNIFKQEIISFKKEEDHLSIIGLNQKNDEFEFILNLQVYEDKTGELIFEEKVKSIIHAWSKKEIHKISSKKFRSGNGCTLAATLVDENNEIIFRNFYSEEKWKHKVLIIPEIDIKIRDENLIVVKSNKPAFFVDLFHPKIEFNDRGFIILPDEEREIKLLNPVSQLIKEDEIKIFTLNNYLVR